MGAGAKLARLDRTPGGAAQAIDSCLRKGRWEVTTQGFDGNLQTIGSDPWASNAYTGLIVPTAPTVTAQQRYLFQLARASFNAPARARIVGLRMYASLVGYVEESTIPFELPIVSPMWRFPDGNISWHVMTVGKRWIDRRNPANTDSVVYQDAIGGAALLYRVNAGGVYEPPNQGRPWGRPLASDLGNIHDLRYPWRDSQVELELDIPVPDMVDVVVYASVWQHDTSLGAPSLGSTQQAAVAPEDRFWSTMTNVQYGRIAASLIFEEAWGKEP